METIPKKRKALEADLQKKVMRFLRKEQNAYLCALTNSPVAPDAGYPDITCVAPDGSFLGIELKKPSGGRQSKKQKKWQSEIEKRGGTYLLASSFEVIYNYIHEKK